MEKNPYVSPKKPAPVLEYVGGDVNRAYDLVSSPAIAMMVLSASWICLVAVGAVSGVVQLLVGSFAVAANPDLAELGFSGTAQTLMQLGWSLVMLISNGVIFYSALRLRSLRSYRFCQLGVFLSVVPCLGPCYVLGIPVGLWALIAMSRPGVREAFIS